MTVGQLFREIVAECGLKLDEKSFQIADTIAPDAIKAELTDEQVEQFRPALLQRAKEILAMTSSEQRAILTRWNSRN